MNDERREGSGSPVWGRVGPADPTADPATEPAMRVSGPDRATVAVPRSEQPTVAVPSEDQEYPDDNGRTRPARVPQRSRIGGWWAGIVLSAVVGVLLLVFIVQNTEPVRITFLWISGSLPTGVALLFAGIAGILLVAIPGTARIRQPRRAARRAR